jgi:hypothetical protein
MRLTMVLSLLSLAAEAGTHRQSVTVTVPTADTNES